MFAIGPAFFGGYKPNPGGWGGALLVPDPWQPGVLSVNDTVATYTKTGSLPEGTYVYTLSKRAYSSGKYYAEILIGGTYTAGTTTGVGFVPADDSGGSVSGDAHPAGTIISLLCDYNTWTFTEKVNNVTSFVHSIPNHVPQHIVVETYGGVVGDVVRFTAKFKAGEFTYALPAGYSPFDPAT